MGKRAVAMRCTRTQPSAPKPVASATRGANRAAQARISVGGRVLQLESPTVPFDIWVTVLIAHAVLEDAVQTKRPGMLVEHPGPCGSCVLA